MLAAFALALLPSLQAPAAAPVPDPLPGPKADGSILLPSGWRLTPHGTQVDLDSDLPIRLALHPDGRWLAIQHAGYRRHQVTLFDTQAGKVAKTLVLSRTWSGMAWNRDGSVLWVSGGAEDAVLAVPFAKGTGTFALPVAHPVGDPKALDLPAGMCARLDGGVVVCTQRRPALHWLDGGGTVERSVALPPGSHPFTCAFAADARTVWVSLWGAAEVRAFDAATGAEVARVATGLHPSELLVHPDGRRLFVANGNEDTVTVVDTVARRATETIGSALQAGAPPGSTPNALALAGPALLLVANADNNALAVIDIGRPGHARSLGFVPTGAYPTAVATSADGGTVHVANGKGSVGSWANPAGPQPDKGVRDPRDYTGSMFAGSLATFPLPAPDALAVLSRRAIGNAPLLADGAVRGLPARPADSPIPARPGDPSPIRHVVYVIKENRTYDQILGDLPQGNGDAALCLFPRAVTPNHHALAETFVLLDNFYVESEVSADGHEWSMGAYATDFVERTWPVSYGGKGKARTPEGAEVLVGYPSEGHFAIATPKAGYLWDLAAAARLGYRSYGEWVENAADPAQPGRARSKTLEGHFDPYYRSFDIDYPDGRRVDRFLVELAQCEQQGELPRLLVVRLPQDHTAGTAVGKFTPQSCVAENDHALGRLLAALSASRFWADMAVFVVEDDAQNGPDHVDAHRSVGLLAGPYVRRGAVVKTLYSTCSMLRTMELILGLPPMSQFDAAALPMWDCFTGTPERAAYVLRPPQVPLDERNGRTAWGAAESSRMDFSVEDAADDLLLNEVIWRSVRGADSPMPPPRRAAFVRALGGYGGAADPDDDDDDRPVPKRR